MRRFEVFAILLIMLWGVPALAQEVSLAAKDDLASVEPRPDPEDRELRKKLVAEILGEAKGYLQRRTSEHQKSLRRDYEPRRRENGLERSLRETVVADKAGKLAPGPRN